MRVIINVVGSTNYHAEVTWPKDWPVPREGESVEIPGVRDITTVVRNVTWYPAGDEDGEISDPFVYVVVGPPRPRA